jgi:hypothetical protein
VQFNQKLSFSMLATLAGAWLLGLADSAQAQQLPRGFEKRLPAVITNEEFIRQRDVWAMEVQFKQMRLVFPELTDPVTGEKRPEPVWYLVWRSINRPVSGRVESDIEPANQLDPLPGPTQFIPEFTLMVYDKPDLEIPEQILIDQIVPEALPLILRRERMKLLDSVSIVQDLPEPVAPEQEQQPWVYGVAMWRGVDPETDFFTVIMDGFSNAYQVRGAEADNGDRQVWRKSIRQRFYRPGDRFEPDEREFSFTGDPEWFYRPDNAAPRSAPQAAE